jgi:hypothetical protein
MVYYPFEAEEITDESEVRLILAKTGFDLQLGAVFPTDTALFGAHGLFDSYVLLQHQEKINLWKLTGDMSQRVGFKKQLEDKLREMQNGQINPGDNIEYFKDINNPDIKP